MLINPRQKVRDWGCRSLNRSCACMAVAWKPKVGLKWSAFDFYFLPTHRLNRERCIADPLVLAVTGQDFGHCL
jgi:hypothetical protein